MNMETVNKVRVRMYPDEETSNRELVKYISNNRIIDTRWTDFWCDRDVIDFEFIGIPEPEDWYGGMMGVQLTNDKGERVIFASWFEETDDTEFDEYFDRVMDAFTLMSKK